MNIWLLLQPFFLALLLIGWLVYSLLRARKSLQVKDQQLQHYGHAAKHFLLRELKVSRSWLVSEVAQTRPNEKSIERARRLFYAIRHHWFKEEINALVDDGLQASNIDRLEQSLIPFCEKLLKDPALPPVEKSILLEQREKNNPVEQLQKQSAVKISLLEMQLSEQRQTIDALRKKLQQLTEQSPVLDEQVQKFTYSNHESTTQVAELNVALTTMRKQYHDLQIQLQQQKNSHHEDGGVLLIQTKNIPVFDIGEEIIQASLEKLQHAYNKVVQEMEHLREANSNKRSLILSLEQELKKVRDSSSDPEIYYESEKLIEKLKIQLRDSEMCTAVLEAESEEMRLRLEAICHADASKEAVDSSAILLDEHRVLKKSAEFKTQLMRCSSELIACKSLEDLTRTLIGYLIPTEFSVTIYTNKTNKECWMATTGAISSETKELMMSIAPDDEWFDTRLGALLSLPHCRILLSHVKQDNHTELLKDIAMIIVTADLVAMQLDLMQKRNQQRTVMTKLIDEAKKSLAALEVQNKYMSDEGGRAMQNHYSQINNFVNTLGLTDNQKDCALEILHELQARMQILFGTRVSLDNSFANLIALLDKKASN